jgi:hypothetical protein
MILFKEDWARFPSAVVDYGTTNKSFLEFAALLDKMGVQNSTFALSLMQPELSGVDIYNPNITTEQKMMVIREVPYNVWYFLREVARVPPIAGIDPVQFRANRANISMVWSFFNQVDYVLIQPRQTGKSVSTDCLSTYLYLFKMYNSRMMLLTKDDTLRSDNVARLRKMRGYFPPWLVLDDKSDAANTTTVTYNLRKNVYRTAVGQNSEDGALKVGRGASVPYYHDDEGPFRPFTDITVPAAASAMDAAIDEARRNGIPNGKIFTTTAGKINSRSGNYYYNKIFRPAAKWDEMYYDLQNRDELHRVIKSASKRRQMEDGVNEKDVYPTLTIAGVFSHRQLGYTDAWLYEKIVAARSDGDAADRDYFNRWTYGGLTSPFTADVTQNILHSERPHDWVEITDSGFVIRWYKPKEGFEQYLANTHLALGLDTSDAIGRDGVSLVYVDQQDLAVVGVASINNASIPKIATFVAKLLLKYLNTTLVIEKKSSAQTFIDTCISLLASAGIDPLTRIYNRVVDEKSVRLNDWDLLKKTPNARRNDSFYDKWRSSFGFNTTGASRDLLYSTVLVSAAKHSASLIADSTLSEELRSLEIRNGRIDHASGGHDDTVIAWLLCHWFFMYGKNLSHYGIDTRKMLLKVGRNGEVATPEVIKARERQEYLREELDRVSEELKNTTSPYLLVGLELKVAKILSELDTEGSDITLDGILAKAKNERALRRNTTRKSSIQRNHRSSPWN